MTLRESTHTFTVKSVGKGEVMSMKGEVMVLASNATTAEVETTYSSLESPAMTLKWRGPPGIETCQPDCAGCKERESHHCALILLDLGIRKNLKTI